MSGPAAAAAAEALSLAESSQTGKGRTITAIPPSFDLLGVVFVPGLELGVERRSSERDDGAHDGLGGQDVAEEDDRAPDDDDALDHVAHPVGHRVHPLQKESFE